MSADFFDYVYSARTNYEYYTIRTARLKRQTFALKLIPALFSSAAIVAFLQKSSPEAMAVAAFLSAMTSVLQMILKPEETLRAIQPIHERYAALCAELDRIDEGVDHERFENAKGEWDSLQADELKVDQRDDDIMERGSELAAHALRAKKLSAITWRGWVRSALFWII
jgi:hypothetical protein